MEATAPSADTIALLRAIARAGFSYQRTKELCRAAGWKLVDDKLQLGYVAFEMGIATGDDAPCRLAVEVRESGRNPRTFVPLYYFEDYASCRQPFDQAFQLLTQQLASMLGQPSSCGTHAYSHREEWHYGYSGWSLDDAELVLVQDEFDIHFGMDVTLWVMPANTTVRLPLNLD